MSKPIADSVTQVALAALALDVCSDVVIQLTNEIAPSENAGTPTATSATGYPSDGQLAPAFGCQESLGTSAEQPPTTNSHANRILGSYARAACSVRDVEHAVARDVDPARSGAERIAVARGAVAGRYVDLVRAAAVRLEVQRARRVVVLVRDDGARDPRGVRPRQPRDDLRAFRPGVTAVVEDAPRPLRLLLPYPERVAREVAVVELRLDAHPQVRVRGGRADAVLADHQRRVPRGGLGARARARRFEVSRVEVLQRRRVGREHVRVDVRRVDAVGDRVCV